MLSRLNAALSVRTRLIFLALIPVVGFAAVGLSYLSSERAVEQAFGSVQRSARLSEVSRSFKDALVAMQASAMIASGRVARPGEYTHCNTICVQRTRAAAPAATPGRAFRIVKKCRVQPQDIGTFT